MSRYPTEDDLVDCDEGNTEEEIEMDAFTESEFAQSHHSPLQLIMEAYEKFASSRPPGISAEIQEDIFSRWTVLMAGPKGSIYEGGCFRGELDFPEEFPNCPPNFKFSTPVPFHPSIAEDGKVCIEGVSEQWRWNPCYSVVNFLLSIQYLMMDITTEDFLNTNAATFYDNDRKQFDEIVKQCVSKSKTVWGSQFSA